MVVIEALAIGIGIAVIIVSYVLIKAKINEWFGK